MGSTGEPDRKRRSFSSLSPTSAKKHSLPPPSEEKKVDTAVLQYQNQKLFQQLEAQKSEFDALENKFRQLKEQQYDYDSTLKVVNRAWEKLVSNLESLSIRITGCGKGARGLKISHAVDDSARELSPLEDDFLGRLQQTGATESSSSNGSFNQKGDLNTAHASTEKVLRNVVAAINDVWSEDEEISTVICESLPKDEASEQLQQTDRDLRKEVNKLRGELHDLHLKHRSIANDVQNHCDIDARNKSELKRLAGELKNTITELEESNCKLMALKAQRDAAQGASFPVLNLGNTHISGEKARDKMKELHDMESTLDELTVQAESRLSELKAAHEERIDILKQLANIQSSLKDMKQICSSKCYLLLSDQLEKSKAEVERYQALLEKLQVEKDSYIWRDREVNLKVDLADISRSIGASIESRARYLETELKKQVDEKNLLECKLAAAAKEPGRKEIIAEFKVMVSSLNKEMGVMQDQMSKYKEAAMEVHSLRAIVQSLSNRLERKTNAIKTLSIGSTEQTSEIQKLQAVVQDLKESEQELKLILEMYGRESTDPREVVEARNMEYKAWAHVQSLKSALDEHNLELRVKAANEAEAVSQQRLAAAEAEIVELRQKLEESGRDISVLTEDLKSKNEEGEAYLSEIEMIGQAYEDMQTQNRHLLQQITERDDYNIKLVLEGVKGRQHNDDLHMETQSMDKEVHEKNVSLDAYRHKVAHVEEQIKLCSEHISKISEEVWHSSLALENTRIKALEIQRESQQLKQLLEESRSKAEQNRLSVLELQIQLENERFDKRRIEEDLEVVTRRAARINARTDGSSIAEKLQDEIKEYKAILKCSICLERSKEVVITKCYHLFCSPCIHKALESRHRKCSICGLTFGLNDVKNVYL
ncbi:E3 ubiquitin-protein ligase BRE1-like 1 [Amborella trichopoda]|uniref:E3 ubiquitin-protein ligase BRE1-like 1 n=1 Tax=Amborella trichopoda TaxID=13333 RepID=UPI0005D466B2|nr:E3 ubiquitin-protein ligase BRE1-like 1 [Amborella trichopoda]|eukprot:XP_011621166.1 E3 ubiquitin-protein ligase BRE1-like 1 [Amborella trichopoda]